MDKKIFFILSLASCSLLNYGSSSTDSDLVQYINSRSSSSLSSSSSSSSSSSATLVGPLVRAQNGGRIFFSGSEPVVQRSRVDSHNSASSLSSSSLSSSLVTPVVSSISNVVPEADSVVHHCGHEGNNFLDGEAAELEVWRMVSILRAIVRECKEFEERNRDDLQEEENTSFLAMYETFSNIKKEQKNRESSVSTLFSVAAASSGVTNASSPLGRASLPSRSSNSLEDLRSNASSSMGN